MLTTIGVADLRAGREVFDCLGDEHFGWLGDCAEAGTDGDGDARYVGAVESDLAGVQPGPPSMPSARFSRTISRAQWTALLGPSKVTRKPSPMVFTSRP